MKTWLKGLAVAVGSALVTAATTMTISPATFNFTKAGLAKTAAAAGVIALKAVLLYLKKSPLGQ